MNDQHYIVFGSPQITDLDIKAIEAVLRSKWIGLGPMVEKFENQFRRYMQTSSAIAVSNCTSGLILAMKSLGIGPGDEVITTDMTFCATVNAIIHVGAIPVIVDCHRSTMNIDPEQIQSHITSRTRTILPVHLAGRPCHMQEIMQIADDNNLFVIEDCAHAIEATIRDKHCGTFGTMGCFSFYVTKNLTCGEGGMVICQNLDIAEKIKILANHGMTTDAWKRFRDKGYCHYDVIYPGYKMNMTDIQASMAIEQFKRLETNWKRRAKLWEYYKNELQDLPLKLPPAAEPNTVIAYHLFQIILETERLSITRDEFMAALHAKRVGTGVHYRALHELQYYKTELDLCPTSFPNASYISERTVSLPFSAALTDSEVDYILTTVKDVLTKYTI